MKKYLVYAVIFLSPFLFCGHSTADEHEPGLIKGKVTVEDPEEAAEWRVYFYSGEPSPYTLEYWRRSDSRTVVNYDGSFSQDLPDGEYYVVILKRVDKKRGGNPAEGDLIFPSANVIEREKYTVRAGEVTDIGVISGPVPFKSEWSAQGRTGIKGRVFDNDGNPIEDTNVRAYTEQGKEIPRFASDKRTDKDGNFLLRLPEGGDYYLIVKGYRIPDAVSVIKGKMIKGVDVYPYRD